MAERTVRKPVVKKVVKSKTTLDSPVKRAIKKKNTSPIAVFFNSVTKQTSNLKTKFQALPKRTLYIGGVILIGAVLVFYFKNLFVAALVNGQPIPRWSIINQVEKDGGQKVLDDLITKTLITQEAAKHKIIVTPQEVDTDLKKIQDSVTKDGGNFDDALASRGLTKVTLLENIRLNKMLDKLLENDLKVTDQEVKDYIEKNEGTLPKDASPEAVQKEAEDKVKTDKRSTKIQELIIRLRKEAKINYFINYPQAAPAGF